MTPAIAELMAESHPNLFWVHNHSSYGMNRLRVSRSLADEMMYDVSTNTSHNYADFAGGYVGVPGTVGVYRNTQWLLTREAFQ